jgi:cholesterol transport system auxiliary component
MHRSTRRQSPYTALIALAFGSLALTGCVKLGGNPPPAQLLSLASPPVSADAGLSAKADGSNSITVMDPNTARKLESPRIPVQVDANSIAYVAEAQWVDTPRKLFRKLLADTITARSNGTLLVMDPAQIAPASGRKLAGELVDFGIDAQSMTAVVTYEATLLQEGGAIIRRRFTATAPIRKIKGTTIAAPLNAAAQKVANDVAEWLKAN